MNEVRVRFAPSPTGHLHIGTARTALLNWLYARRQQGVFIVRIEDTDRSRSTVIFEESILEDLAWMGLNWDEGPDIGGKYGPYRQSERFELYQQKADELIRLGQAYRCYCTPKELEERRKAMLAAGLMPKYEGTCRLLTEEQEAECMAQGRKPAIRFRVPDGRIVVHDITRGDIEFSSDVIGDFVILRSDGSPSYHLAVVVDDGEMRITHVIRGEDHITNTAKHIPLFMALGYPVPKFAHNAMILGPDGGKLSKRHGATSVSEYRANGYLPEAINNYLALLSWAPEDTREIFSLEELAWAFTIERISKSPAIFDINKLNWLSGQHIRLASLERITNICIPYLREAGLLPEGGLSKKDFARLMKIIEAVRGNLTVLSEIPEYAKIFLGEYEIEPEADKWLIKPHAPEVLDALLGLIYNRGELDIEGGKKIMGLIRQAFKPLGITGKDLFMPIRVALTGSIKGPELPHVLNILDRAEIMSRIDKAIKRAQYLQEIREE
ncbi:MAG: glutamate--tRNA ligase [Actinobacteria bacterium]|nr:glutamate--tRNA ligase [Actinomycetota bacterium]